MCICICVYIYIHTHIYTYIYIYRERDNVILYYTIIAHHITTYDMISIQAGKMEIPFSEFARIIGDITPLVRVYAMYAMLAIFFDICNVCVYIHIYVCVCIYIYIYVYIYIYIYIHTHFIYIYIYIYISAVV